MRPNHLRSTSAARVLAGSLLVSTMSSCTDFRATGADDSPAATKMPSSGGSATRSVGGQPNDVGLEATAGATSPATGGSTAAAATSGGTTSRPTLHLHLEAEDAQLSNGAVRVAHSDASAESYVDMSGSGVIEFRVTVPTTTTYSLTIAAAVPAGWGKKTNDIVINGAVQTTFQTNDQNGTGTFYTQSKLWVELETGDNALTLEPSWGWVRVDYIRLDDIEPDHRPIAPTLVTAHASSNAQRLMRYLVDGHGKRILAGQQGIDYVPKIQALTGKEPAIVGFDLMDYSPSRHAYMSLPAYGETERAIAWWRDRKGIVSFCWHWNAPLGLLNRTYVDSDGNTIDASWYRGFYTNASTFDVAEALANPYSPEYQAILRDIDAIAVQLKKLAAAAVPVLFRPLHEASGGWFWWGAQGAGPYIALYRLLYERLTYLHHLDNLIWVQNGQATDYYPGDDVVDIVAEDIYGPKRDYSPQVGRYSQALQYSTLPKLVALSENGALLDPIRLNNSLSRWSWFSVWSGDEFIVSEEWNENSMKRAVYLHEYVTTLDELPDIAQLSLTP